MMKKIRRAIVTCCGIGYTPLMPGTSMSLVTFLFAFFIPMTTTTLFLASIIFLALGIPLSHIVEKEMKKTDPSCIVIDELVGMLLSFLFLPHTIISYGLAFLFFRLFDTTKMLGGRFFERLPGGWGIMLDDVYAAAQTLLVVHGIQHFFPL